MKQMGIWMQLLIGCGPKALLRRAKKSGRVASEGLVAIAVSGGNGALVELNSETDFVSRNDEFQGFASTLATLALNADNLDGLNAMDYPETGRNVADELTQKIATIGENMTLRRMEKVVVSEGAVVPYIHNAAADGLGRIGVLVGLQSSASADVLSALGKQLAIAYCCHFTRFFICGRARLCFGSPRA